MATENRCTCPVRGWCEVHAAIGSGTPSEAEALARVTGSVAATVTHERRDAQGILHTDSVDVYVRGAE